MPLCKQIQPPKVASGDMDLTVAWPDKKTTGDRDGQAMACVGLVVDRSSNELGHPLSGDLEITPRVFGELAQVAPPPSPPGGGTEPGNSPKALRSPSLD